MGGEDRPDGHPFGKPAHTEEAQHPGGFGARPSASADEDDERDESTWVASGRPPWYAQQPDEGPGTDAASSDFSRPRVSVPSYLRDDTPSMHRGDLERWPDEPGSTSATDHGEWSDAGPPSSALSGSWRRDEQPTSSSGGWPRSGQAHVPSGSWRRPEGPSGDWRRPEGPSSASSSQAAWPPADSRMRHTPNDPGPPPVSIPEPRPLTDPGLGPMGRSPVPGSYVPPSIERIPPQREPSSSYRSGAYASGSLIRPPPSRRGNFVTPALAAGGVILVSAVVALLASVVFAPPADIDPEPPMMPVVGGPVPPMQPPAPFDVKAPRPFGAELLEGEALASDQIPSQIARDLAEGRLDRAAAWSDRLVREQGQPARFFDHARLLSEQRQVDAAYYWLIRAVTEHGVQPAWLVQDRAFRWLWVDERWDAFIRWVAQSSRFHASRGAAPATVIVPTDLDAAAKLAEARWTDEEKRDRRRWQRSGKGPFLPVVLWLGDAGAHGERVVGWGQDLADDLGAIVIGVGGPTRIGPAGSAWTGDPTNDFSQLTKALKAVPNAQADDHRTLLAGLGQGAQYAVELALRDTSFVDAVLALGPTDTWQGPRDAQTEGQTDRSQVATLQAGALDEDAQAMVHKDRGRLSRAGIDVSFAFDEQPWAFGEPPDLDQRVSDWARLVLDGPPEVDAGDAQADATEAEATTAAAEPAAE